MNAMDAIATSLFALTAAALKKTTFEIPVPDPERFFQMAREQGLSGTVYPAMPKGTDPVLLSRLRKDFFRFAEADVLQQKMVADLDRILAEDRIPHLYLKGAYMKELYPEAWMRSMGDIDILVPEAELKRVGAILVSLGMELMSEGPTHDLYGKGKLEVEVHPRLDIHFDPKHLKALEGLWDRAIPGKGSSLRMPEEDTVLYLLAHMAKHFRSSGVGVRSILDVGICVEKFRNTLSWKTFLPRLRSAGLERLFLTTVWLNERWFAIVPPAGLVFPEDFTDDFFEDLTAYVLSSGIHGKAEGFNSSLPRMSTEAASGHSPAAAKRRAFFHSLFPSVADAAPTYPYLKKHPWLLPVAWVSRIFRLLFTRTKHTFRKLSEYGEDPKEVAKKGKLYQKMGL